MEMKPVVAPIVDSTAVFKRDIFNGKVLFCTGWYLIGHYRQSEDTRVNGGFCRRGKRDMSGHDRSDDAPWCKSRYRWSQVC